MEHDCNYDKIKLLEEVSHVLWVIGKHYIPDAEKAKHPLCAEMYKEIARDLKKHREKLIAAVAGLSKEGKFR